MASQPVPQEANEPGLGKIISSCITFVVACLFGIAGLFLFLQPSQVAQGQLNEPSVYGVILIGIGIIIMQNLYRSFDKFD